MNRVQKVVREALGAFNPIHDRRRARPFCPQGYRWNAALSRCVVAATVVPGGFYAPSTSATFVPGTAPTTTATFVPGTAPTTSATFVPTGSGYQIAATFNNPGQ